MKSIYTIPKILIPKNQADDWCVWFRYDGKLKRYKKGINYFHDLKERRREANALREALHQSLKEGWNPNQTDEEIQLAAELSRFSEMTLTEALRFGLDNKTDISRKTKCDYESTLRFITAAISDSKLDNLKASETKRPHIRIIMDKAKSLNQWSNNSYNKYLTNLSAIISELIEFEIIEYNPCTSIKRKKIEKSDKHRPPTTEEFRKIVKALIPHPNFFRYCDAVYQTLCREVELLRLQVKMIDLDNRTITLPAGVTKSRTKSRTIPINSFMYAYLEEMDIKNTPGDYFVFGTSKTPIKSRLYRTQWLSPGPNQIHVNRVSEFWKELIKDGEAIDVTLYALKSAGVDSLLTSGAALEAVSGLAGHASTEMTATYYASVLAKQYRDEVIKHERKFGSLE